jgi:putative transposase
MGEFYHLYNRGNDKRDIFLDDSDYKRFVYLMFFCNSNLRIHMKDFANKLARGDTLGSFMDTRGETLVDIGAFCLMPNHFHILAREREENGLVLFMKKLCTGYSMYFNIKKDRTGKLFEGPFKAEHLDYDQYLKYIFSYIHLNPAKLVDSQWRENALADFEKIRDFVEGYKYSSYRNYLGNNTNIEVLNSGPFPDYFGARGMRVEIGEWLNLPEVSPRGEELSTGGRV